MLLWGGGGRHRRVNGTLERSARRRGVTEAAELDDFRGAEVGGGGHNGQPGVQADAAARRYAAHWWRRRAFGHGKGAKAAWLRWRTSLPWRGGISGETAVRAVLKSSGKRISFSHGPTDEL